MRERERSEAAVGLIANGAAVVGRNSADADQPGFAEMEETVADGMKTVGASGGGAGAVGLHVNRHTARLLMVGGMERPVLRRRAHHRVDGVLHVLMERLHLLHQRRITSEMWIWKRKQSIIIIIIIIAITAVYSLHTTPHSQPYYNSNR